MQRLKNLVRTKFWTLSVSVSLLIPGWYSKTRTLLSSQLVVFLRFVYFYFERTCRNTAHATWLDLISANRLPTTFDKKYIKFMQEIVFFSEVRNKRPFVCFTGTWQKSITLKKVSLRAEQYLSNEYKIE